MDIDFMVYAAPMFLILIGIEGVIVYYKQTKTYQFNDTINNLGSGIFEEISALPFRGLIIYSYYYLYEHYAFLSINTHSFFFLQRLCFVVVCDE